MDKITRYVVKKNGKYLDQYQHQKACWCYGLDVAHHFRDLDMASDFARITKGTVVEIEIREVKS